MAQLCQRPDAFDHRLVVGAEVGRRTSASCHRELTQGAVIVQQGQHADAQDLRDGVQT
jgi:hypothetical protein